MKPVPRKLHTLAAAVGIVLTLCYTCSVVQAQANIDRRNVTAVIQQYDDASESYQQRRRELKTSEERAKLRSELLPQLADAEADAAVDWAKLHEDDALALRALRLVMQHGTQQAKQKAVDAVIANHLDLKGDDFRALVMSLHEVNEFVPCAAEKCLRAFIEQGDDRTTRGVAGWMLAMYKADNVQSASLVGTDAGRRIPQHRAAHLKELDCEATLSEAILILERVKRDFGTLSIQIGPGKTATLSEIAERDRQRVHGLLGSTVGRPAPPIIGRDVNGEELKLSEFRGKVVVVNFWTTNCAPCIRLIPDEKRLVEKYRNEPFALLGVNLDPDRETAKTTITKHGVTWHNWWIEPDEQEGITTAWNVQFRPTIYVLDKNGVIRFAHLRGDKLTEAIDVLLNEIE
jgi:thiol-disulfide isomerase/thioredoxin